MKTDEENKVPTVSDQQMQAVYTNVLATCITTIRIYAIIKREK